MHKSHLTSQGSLLFSYCYMPHLCFALPLWMLCKILSSCQELSFRSSSKYTLTQPPVCPAQRSEEPPGLSLCFSSHCLGEARPSVLSLLPLGLPSLFEALLFGFWLPLSPSSWTHPVTWQKDQERKWRHKHGTNLLCYKKHVKIRKRVVVSPSSDFCSLK